MGPLLLLVVPAVIRRFADALPAGSLQDGVAHLWRLSVLAALLLTVFLSATSIVNWLMRELVIRERRLEIWTGLLGHRHVMLWLHDLERPLTVRQFLWQLALNLGTLEITSTMLPTPKRGGRPCGSVICGSPGSPSSKPKGWRRRSDAVRCGNGGKWYKLVSTR